MATKVHADDIFNRIERAYNILALQRLLHDNGERLSDYEVRGNVVNDDLLPIKDEWS